jgi:hypothetical protein
MTLRKQARASIHPAALLSARLAAWGSSWARDRNVDVDSGGVRWQWIGYGKDKHQIAQIVTAKLIAKGNVLLQGYIQLVADGDVYAWIGELDAAGKLVCDEVGAVLPDKGASL